MFDISPLCQANLALWHAITGLITAVCGLEGTRAAPAALTGPDRLIRSVGTQKSSSQTPHISLRARNSLQMREALFSPFAPSHVSFLLRSSVLTFPPFFPFLADSGFSGANQISWTVCHLCLAPSFQHLPVFQFCTPTQKLC